MASSVGRSITWVVLSVLVLSILVVSILYVMGGSSIPEVKPVDLSSKERVEAGRYLATAGNCSGCHTRPGEQEFSGGVAFNTDFGIIYSSNITPNEENGIGTWSAGEFVRAMRSGMSADGTHLYPVFPYTHYALVSDEDILSIFAYLKTLDPVASVPPENSMRFPFGFRPLLAIWKTLFLDSSSFENNPDLSDFENRGAYLVNGLAHCGGCHSPRNSLGALTSEGALSGGVHMDKVEPGKIRLWSAVNLTPAENGLKAWSEDDLISYLKTGHSKMGVSFGPMNKVISNSTQHLTMADIEAMTAYLKSVAPVESKQHFEQPDEDLMDEGEILYDSYCGTCHLPTGLGDEKTGTQLVGSAVALADNPASLINIILYGAKAPVSLDIPDELTSMKGFSDKLDDSEVAILATYVRNSWGNKASPVTEQQVADQF